MYILYIFFFVFFFFLFLFGQRKLWKGWDKEDYELEKLQTSSE